MKVFLGSKAPVESLRVVYWKKAAETTARTTTATDIYQTRKTKSVECKFLL
jgi:hypothetical protein